MGQPMKCDVLGNSIRRALYFNSLINFILFHRKKIFYEAIKIFRDAKKGISIKRAVLFIYNNIALA